MTESIPMSSPDLTAAEVAAVDEVLSTRWLALGPKLKAFEEAFASYVGAAHAVAVVYSAGAGLPVRPAHKGPAGTARKGEKRETPRAPGAAPPPGAPRRSGVTAVRGPGTFGQGVALRGLGPLGGYGYPEPRPPGGPSHGKRRSRTPWAR